MNQPTGNPSSRLPELVAAGSVGVDLARGGSQPDADVGRPAHRVGRWWRPIERRVRLPWTVARLAQRAELIPRALALVERRSATGGLCESETEPKPSVALTRAAIAVLAPLADDGLLQRWRGWLAAMGDGRDSANLHDARATAPDWLSDTAVPGTTYELAQRALAGFRQGDWTRAQRAAERLLRSQQPDGGFPVRLSRWRRQTGEPSSTRATLLALQVAQAQVAASFAGTRNDLPSEVHAEDGRWRALKHEAALLPPGARVAEIGCGSGRFLARLAAFRPDLRLVGVDPTRSFLATLPWGVERAQGTLERIPLATGVCDLVVAIESLEHSLWPERAVAELGRVTRARGTLLIIDKQRRCQPLSDYEPWERWFSAGDLAEWLAPWAGEFLWRPISHGAPARHGLFFAATARRCAANRSGEVAALAGSVIPPRPVQGVVVGER